MNALVPILNGKSRTSQSLRESNPMVAVVARNPDVTIRFYIITSSISSN